MSHCDDNFEQEEGNQETFSRGFSGIPVNLGKKNIYETFSRISFGSNKFFKLNPFYSA